jgi:topoisomerase-4 subunit B
VIDPETDIDQVLAYYMGKNTPLRQEFIIDNLRVEKDELDDQEEDLIDEAMAEAAETAAAAL